MTTHYIRAVAITSRDRNNEDTFFWEAAYFTAVRQLREFCGGDEAKTWIVANVDPQWSWLRMARTVQEQVAVYQNCRHDFHTEHGSDGSGEPDGDVELVICHECGLNASDDYLAHWKAEQERNARTAATLAAREHYQRA